MAKYLVEFWMDGYEDQDEMAKQGISVIEEALDSAGSSAKVTLLCADDETPVTLKTGLPLFPTEESQTDNSDG